MANIKFSRKIFEKDIGKLTTEMQNNIALFGTTLENFNEEEIELEIFPDRPDLLSYHGFKRGFLAFLGKKTGLKKYTLNKPEKNFEVIVENSVKNIRPFTTCAIVKGIKFDNDKIKEIIDLQEKLHGTIGRKRKKVAIGIYPLEKIELPIRYKAIEPDKIKFIPLESSREMSGLQILQKHQAGKEYAHLLSGKATFPIFIDSKDNILSMPPIINSEQTGRVDEKTKEIFIECSGFDLEILKKTLNIIVSILSEMGGEIYQMKVNKEITPDFKNEETKLSLENTNKLLGLELKEKEISQLLEKMGHSYKEGIVYSPAYRTDLLHEVDIIEDIAIAYGYNNFEANIPKISTIGKEDDKEIMKRKFTEILVGLGLLEISNYHLTKKGDQFTKMGILEKQEKNFIELEDSKTDFNIMRKDLTHYLLKIISENNDSEYPQEIFELGRVFNLNDKEEIIETEKMSCATTPGNFTRITQILNYFKENLKIDLEIKEQEKTENHFVEGRAGDIFLDKEKIGSIGEIHPKILKNWKIKMPVSLFEIELEKIFEKFK